MKKPYSSFGPGYVLRPLLFLAATLIVLAASAWYVFADVSTSRERVGALIHCMKQQTCKRETVSEVLHGHDVKVVEVYDVKRRLTFHYQLSDEYFSVAVVISENNIAFLRDFESRGRIDVVFHKIGSTIHLVRPGDTDYEEQMQRAQKLYYIALHEAWHRLVPEADKKAIIEDGILPRTIGLSKWKA